MKLPFLPRPPGPTPYCQGYLAAHAAGTMQVDGGIVRMPRQVYSAGTAAQCAFIEGITDSILDRGPRLPTDRVSRAHPPLRQI